MTARQWAFFSIVLIFRVRRERMLWYRRNNCFNLFLSLLLFPSLSLSRSERPADCCCLLGVCNKPPNPSSSAVCGRFHFRPPINYLGKPPRCNLFGSTRGYFGAKQVPRGGKKVLLLCNMIRTHDVMMGPLF